MKTIQLVPSEINGKFGHLGGVGEINAGAFKPGNLPINRKGKFKMKINDAVLVSLNMIMSGVEILPLSFAAKKLILLW